MPLIELGSRVAPTELRRIYAEHRAELASLGALLRAPPGPVADAGRRMNGQGLAEAMLRLLPERDANLPDDRLVDYVNASYEVMVGLIYLMKTAFGLPMVPAPRI
ncbi:MAG: hypothetical protein ACREDK_06220 [Thermoplasmata archaeon]